ncbi:MAG: hypothetical protein AABY86_08420 [Bdellovibrionota bacterium]
MKLASSILMVFSLILLVLPLAQADELTILSAWQSENAPEGLENMVVVRDQENEYAGDHLVFFGKKNGALKVRLFHLPTLNLYLSTNSHFEAFDEYQYIEGVVLRAQKYLKLKFFKENNVAEHETDYCRNYTKELGEYAEKALEILKLRMSELEHLKTYTSMSQFKRAIFRIKDRMGMILQDDANYGLPVHSLQSEQEWAYWMPLEKYRKTFINDNGSDILSQDFRQASEWSDEQDIPRKGKGIYSFYREGAKAFTKQVYKDGASRFVRYEVVNVRFVKCQQQFEKIQEWIWVLTDGSVFSYTPSIDCD